MTKNKAIAMGCKVVKTSEDWEITLPKGFATDAGGSFVRADTWSDAADQLRYMRPIVRVGHTYPIGPVRGIADRCVLKGATRTSWGAIA